VKEAQAYEKRNFVVFFVNQVLMRIGWIFKTESVVMPGFIDAYTSSDWIRGCLPLISRIGQSLPQFFIAPIATRAPRKQRMFVAAGYGVMIPWFALALILGFTGWSASVIVSLFLLLYAAHWFALGCHTLAQGTLQGKLIRPERRGGLLGYSNIVGCALAIAAAFLAMTRWLDNETAHYELIFGATGLFFGLAATTSLYFREPPSPPPQTMPFFKFLSSGLLLLRHDQDFRRFAVVLLLFYMLWPLFPHYTVFGKRRLGLGTAQFATLVIAQNTVSAFGSWVVGMIADRRGNRIALRMLIFVMACVPLLAIALTRMPSGAETYWLVYAFLGLTPVANRIVTNYTLEISPQEKHPQYLSVMSLVEAIPLLISPLLGALIEKFSFELIFSFCAALSVGAGVLTFRLSEPRFAASSEDSGVRRG
jgi:MFS family permease